MADDVLSQMLGRPISTITGKPVPTAQEKIAPGKEIIDFLSAMLPGIGDVRDIGEAVTGKDMWGEKLSPGARLITALAAVLPVIPGAIRNVPKMSDKLKGMYDTVFSKLPKKIQEGTNVKSIKVGRFPADAEGEGGRLIIDRKGDYHIVLERGDPDLPGVLRHELLHAHELANPTKGKGMDLFAEERMVEALEKGLK